MSNITGEEGSFSSDEVQQQQEEKQQLHNHLSLASTDHNTNTTNNASTSSHHQHPPPPPKKKRNLPGTPDPTAEVVALSPTTLMATNRFVCEICSKGFQRDQNLQLHRRGHNLPWKLRQRATTEIRKRVYICPEPSCVHHNPARALGDLTGIKKHYSRKHGEKKWKCDKCSKKYAVQSDWKAHQKTCGTREYKCDCGTIFSRRDSFITHRAFCDALAEENNKVNQGHSVIGPLGQNLQAQMADLMSTMPITTNTNTSMGLSEFTNPLKSLPQELLPIPFKPMNMFSTSSGTLFGSPRSGPSSSSGLQLSSSSSPSGYNYQQDNKNLGQFTGSAHMSATALLQKAAQMGATATNSMNSPMMQKSFVCSMAGPDQISGPGPGPGPRPISNVHSFDAFQAQNEQPSGFNGGFATQLLQKSPVQEMAQLFESGGAGGSAVSDMVMYGGMLMGGDGSSAAGFLKNVMEVQGESDQNCGLGQVKNNNIMARTPTRIGAGDDMTTVDFLGVGGSRPQNEHYKRLEMEGMNEQRMQVMQNPFHQQDFS